MKCVFCKCDSEDSKSVEHVIPESLGSKTTVLPRGLVCDKCNNYFSHKVEMPILSHPSFKNIIAWYQVPSKKGRMRSVNGVQAGTDINISMKLDANGKLDIQPERERNILNNQLIEISNGEYFNPFIFKLDIDPPKKEMSKFLAKMGLEFLVYRFRNDKDMIELIVNSAHYDPIRNYARKGHNSKDWPYSIRRIYPIDTKMVHPKSGEWVMAGIGYDLLLNQRKETYFVFLFYGVEFVINLGGPSIDGYNEWLELTKNISPIIERYGNQVIIEMSGGKGSYIVQNNYNVNNGILFDEKQLYEFTSNSLNNGQE